MKNYPTAHINASPKDFAETVLMPGDPKRAKFIAENYLENSELVSSVRNIYAYKGIFKGMPISVMASGMGIPSIGIYSYELYNVFGVENIIRLGSAGGICDDVKIRDIIIAQGCSTNSNFAAQFCLPGTFAPLCSFDLLEKAVQSARKNEIEFKVGNIFTTDNFYEFEEMNNVESTCHRWARMGVLCVEMETAGLYMTAARMHKKALAILTVTDHLKTGENLSSDERRKSLTDMIKIGLDTATSI